MAEIKTTGIILRYANYGEYNRMLTLFSPELGKVSFSARSCRKPGAKLLPSLEQFCYGEYALTGKQDKYTVTQCVLKESFYGLRTDLKIFAHATYFVNLCEEFVVPGEGNPELFSLLLRGLTLYCYSGLSPNTITACLLVKLLELVGYMPNLDYCVSCGQAVTEEAGFSHAQGGVLCSDCAKEKTLSWPMLVAMRRLQALEVEKIKNVRMEQSMADAMNQLLTQYLDYHVGRKFKSEEFLLSLM